MKMPLSEIADRLSILHLKMQRLPHNDKVAREFDAYSAESHEVPPLYVHRLYEVNGKIWDLEADIRQGKEGTLGLEEVGRRALAIRDLNAQRIAIKNELAAALGEFIEVKGNHASEQTPPLQP